MAPKVTQEMKTAIKETVKELLSDEEFIDRIFKKVSERVNVLEKTVKEQEQKIEQLETKLINMEQNFKQNNICIYGIEENEHENINEKVLKICNVQVKVSIQRDDVIKSYRIGRNTNNSRPRPVIVKLDRIYLKNTILKNRKHLKGTKIVIGEDLTKSRLLLLKEVQQSFDKKSVFTHDGNIYLKMANNVNKKIRSQAELQQTLAEKAEQ